MIRCRISFLAFFAVLAGSITVNAGSVTLPPVNLGKTSFEDGIANPGWFFEEIIDYYHAGQFNDSAGARMPGQNEITTVSSLTHSAYFSHYKISGGCIGAELLVPLVDADLNASFKPHNHKEGVGDVIIRPFMMQWDDRQLLADLFSSDLT
jgi:hypothetical protein